MGGRGAINTTGSRNMPTSINKMPQKKPKTAKDFTNIADLRDYAQNTLGVEIGKSMDGMDYSLVQKAVEHYEYLKSEFPQWATVTKLRARNLNPSTNAQTNGNIITVNAMHFNDANKYEARIAQAMQRGYYPKNTTGDTTSVHEMGHTLEQALVDKFNPGTDYYATYDRLDAWNKHKYSKQVISEAAKAVKKTAAGKGKTNDALVAEVSRYATTTRAEAMAECVRDYVINKNNAHPLSQEVWKILKRELG